VATRTATASGAARRRLAPDQARRRALDVAGRLFAARGYDGLVFDAIAERAGVSRSWLYSQFPDRKAVLVALIRRDVDDFVRRFTQAVTPAADLDQMLRDAYGLFLSFVDERRTEYLTLYGPAGRMEPEVASLLHELRERSADFYTGAFRRTLQAEGVRLLAEDEQRLVTHALMSLADGAVQAWLADPSLPRAVQVDTVVGMFHRILFGRSRSADGAAQAHAAAEEGGAASLATARMEAAMRGELVAHLLGAQELERGRLAREIHDELGQTLTYLGYSVSSIERAVEAGAPAEELTSQLHELRAHVRTTIDQVRRIAFNLRPSTLDNAGLDAALRTFVKDWSGRTGIPVDLSIQGKLAGLHEDVRTAAYRVIQEALTNVARHSEATAVVLSLKRGARALTVTVEDNGRGFEPPELDDPLVGSMGLRGMSERVRLVAGSLRVESKPGHGSTVKFTVPA